jgi:hypothetical protein
MMMNQNHVQPLGSDKEQQVNGQGVQGLPANYGFLKNMVLEDIKKSDSK